MILFAEFSHLISFKGNSNEQSVLCPRIVHSSLMKITLGCAYGLLGLTGPSICIADNLSVKTCIQQ